MRLYFHHVGETGARRDFPRTIWNEINIRTVEESISDDNPYRAPLLRDLNSKFPSGKFNVWGVPQGAATVIRNLCVGDVVLLVETIRLGGCVPALCSVSVFEAQVFPELSKALWTESHFPYIFFFNTERIDLTWEELRRHLGYSDRFDPRGQFYRVKEGKPEEFLGPARYVKWLREERVT